MKRNVSFILMLFCCTFLLMSKTGQAQQAYSVISAPEVYQLLEKKEAVLIHVLSRIEYESQHIPGSINIPINELENSDKLPQNLDTPVVFYCMGTR